MLRILACPLLSLQISTVKRHIGVCVSTNSQNTIFLAICLVPYFKLSKSQLFFLWLIQSFPSYEKFGLVLYWNVRSLDCFHMKCRTVRKSMLGSTT